MPPAFDWFRRTVAWSNSAQSWKERASVALLLAWATVLIWFHQRLALATQVVFWALLVVAGAALLRRGWLKLFGPVLFYDLVRVGRKTRYVVLRTLYSLGLLAILSFFYWAWWENHRYEIVDPLKMAQFTEEFFLTFMSVQLTVTLILTPAYVAGAIADEKDRKTLEFLLATDLRSREIVLGKLVSRLANVMLIILAGLPILSFTQFLGGVDPGLLIAGFVATAMTALSLACLSMLWSVFSNKARDAILMTYLSVVLYFAAALTCLIVVHAPTWSIGTWGITFPEFLGGREFNLIDLADIVNAGNLFYALQQIITDIDRGQSAADVVPALLFNYSIFHTVVAGACVVWSIWRLRPIALKERFAKAARAPLFRRIIARPPIGDSAMLWKEVFAEPGIRMHWLGRIAILLLVGLSLVPLGGILKEFVDILEMQRYGNPQPYRGFFRSDAWEFLRGATNVYARITGAMVAALMLIAVSVRAAGSVTSERDKQTLDELLTSPLESSSILFAKWVGSILSVRWTWLWLGLIAALPLAIGGLHPLSVPVVIICWFVYASLFAGIGLLFSVRCRTTLQATMFTLLTTIFVGGGHWFVTMCCCLPIMAISGSHERDFEYFLKAQLGFTPPFVLGAAGFRDEDFQGSDHHRDEIAAFSIFGILVSGAAGVGLLAISTAEFNRITGREGASSLTAGPRMPSAADQQNGVPHRVAADEVQIIALPDNVREPPPPTSG